MITFTLEDCLEFASLDLYCQRRMCHVGAVLAEFDLSVEGNQIQAHRRKPPKWAWALT